MSWGIVSPTSNRPFHRMDGAHQATATKVQLAGYLVKWQPWEPCCRQP